MRKSKANQPRSIYTFLSVLFIGPLLLSPSETIPSSREIERPPVLKCNDYASAKPLPQELTVLSWNVQKFENSLADKKLHERNDTLQLLQESIEPNNTKNPLFAQGYSTSNFVSGVEIRTQSKPSHVCQWTTVEPYLRTPKAGLISLFNIQHSQQQLMVINLHSINFEWNMIRYTEQLAPIIHQIDQHNGPVLIAGDFNTWRLARLKLIRNIMLKHGLKAVHFDPDDRARPFGLPLDWMYIRGLSVESTESPKWELSDHEPIIAKLQVIN